MTLKRYDLEGGTDGANLTTGNTGAVLVNVGSGNSARFEADAATTGTLGGQIVCGGTGNPLIRFAPASPSKTMAFAIDFRPVASSATGSIIQLLNGSDQGVVYVAHLPAGGDRRLEIQLASGNHILMTPGQYQADTTYRLEMM